MKLLCQYSHPEYLGVLYRGHFRTPPRKGTRAYGLILRCHVAGHKWVRFFYFIQHYYSVPFYAVPLNGVPFCTVRYGTVTSAQTG